MRQDGAEIKDRVKELLDAKLASAEFQWETKEPIEMNGETAEARAFAHAERRRRVGLSLFFGAPISMGCAIYLPRWEQFRWGFFVLGLLYFACALWNLNRADLD